MKIKVALRASGARGGACSGLGVRGSGLGVRGAGTLSFEGASISGARPFDLENQYEPLTFAQKIHFITDSRIFDSRCVTVSQFPT